ncbi:hypothetical protein HDV06_002646 [Boothiomyces sp. JEL0866]|nr:hypothetical protein HDV06_002646 [Boothiomyces sp. JEL0866]
MTQEEEQNEELLNQKLLVNSGLDSDDHPIFSFYSCFFPAHHDQILPLIISKLEQLSFSQYTIIFFCSSKNMPLNWLLAAYYKLNFKIRKNLKKLVVVYPNAWAKMVFQTMGFILSPKFSRKLEWVNTLSESKLKLEHFNIPNEIIDQEPLPLLYKPNSDRIVYLLGDFIKENIKTEGLFRIPGNKHTMDQTIKRLHLNTRINLNQVGVHGCCSLLKQYFRESKESVFPCQIKPKSKEFVAELLSKVDEKLWRYLFELLNMVHNEKVTLMTASNLAIVWTMNFLEDVSKYEEYSVIVQYMIEEYNTLF